MNNKQQNILWIGISLITLMGLIPPWCQHGPNDFIVSKNYAPIFLPPEGCVIDTNRLLLQWFLVVVVYAAWNKIGKPPKYIPLMLVTIFVSWTACYVFSGLFIQNIFDRLSIRTLLQALTGRSSATHSTDPPCLKGNPDFSNLPPVKNDVIPDSVSTAGNVDLSDVKNLPSLNATPRLP